MPADGVPEVAMPAGAMPADALALAALAERTPGVAVAQNAPGGAAPVVAVVDAEPAWAEVVRAEAWELESAPSCVQPTVQRAQASASVGPEPAGPVSPVWGAGEVRLGASLRKKN